jgi:ribose transport system permease protein
VLTPADDAPAPGVPVDTAPLSYRQARSPLARFSAEAPPWMGVAIVLAVMVVGLIVLRDDLFLTWTNFNNILRGSAITLVLATGSTILLTTGMIDLSIGSLIALCTMVLAGFFNLGWPAVPAIIGTIVVGAALGGGVNGVLVAKAKLSFFVVTLGTLALFRSLAQLPTEGRTIQLTDKPAFGLIKTLGDGEVGAFSVPVLIALGVLLLGALVLRYTNFGRAVFAVGGNEAAARLAGIRVDRIRIAVFAINGGLVGVAAVIFAGRIQSASALIGQGIELQVIAAVLLGGTSFLGGAGSLVGTLIGVLFIAVLQNGLSLLEVPTFWQGVVTGAVLILAVWVDRLRSRA